MSEDSAAIAERKITVFFNRSVPDGDQRVLFNFDGDGNPVGELAPYLSGYIQWLLDMPYEDVHRYVKKANSVLSLEKDRKDAALESDPMLRWVDECCLVRPGDEGTQVGMNDAEKSGNWLYPNYCDWCRGSGVRPKGLKTFVDHLRTIAKSNDLAISYEKKGGRTAWFSGFVLRAEHDDQSPCPVSGPAPIAEPSSKNALSPELLNSWTDAILACNCLNELNRVVSVIGKPQAKELRKSLGKNHPAMIHAQALKSASIEQARVNTAA